MKYATLFLASAGVAQGLSMEQDPVFEEFQRFVFKFNKRYNNQAEVNGRFNLFKQNLDLINERNSDNGTDAHGVNQFADMHPQEFRQQYLGTKLVARKAEAKDLMVWNKLAAPANIDWRTQGAITPVKNQGQCGSCWAFSTTQQIESDTFLATGVLPVLSPQQLVSCDTTDSGCNGGDPINAYQYVQSAGGIEYLANYPYTSGTTQQNGQCNFQQASLAPSTSPSAYNVVSQSPSQESNMYTQIQNSPMSVCVDATIWQTYTSGIISAADNCGTSTDHAVQAVGIGGASTSQPYWIVSRASFPRECTATCKAMRVVVVFCSGGALLPTLGCPRCVLHHLNLSPVFGSPGAQLVD
jgi:C1A family cysteine protease